jgi:gamma-glutamyltranspeptidase/glutathione hydrolase
MPQLKSGVVVAAHPLAARAGVNMLRKGGNAIDAAVATALALGTVTPAFCGIGGGGFALVWLAREEEAVFVDYRERAPRAATQDMFQVTAKEKVVGNANSVGYRAVAVPGSVAGHSLLLEKYGRLGLKNALSPAIGYARRGFRVSRALAYASKLSVSKLRRFKNTGSTYLRRGRTYHEGEKIALKALAETFASIRKNGPNEFYTGNISKKISETIRANGGLLSIGDLEHFKPVVREPVRGTYREFEVISAPPPSSGGATILQTLNMLENYQLKELGQNSTRALHLISETMARSLTNCRTNICDPDSSSVPVDGLISKDVARRSASTIRLDAASPQLESSYHPSRPTSSTSHLVTVDAEHNVVSMTESIECYFGSGVIASDTGILLNDTMHDFDPRPDRLNSVAPWKIPMSSMSPTIMMKDGRPIMAAGSAGATRIISSTLQAILNVLDFGMNVGDAVRAPRIHVQENLLQIEAGISVETVGGLRRMGHAARVMRSRDPLDPGLYFGGVHAVQLRPDGVLEGAADPRRDGQALGLP